jgi:hypothetical protein
MVLSNLLKSNIWFTNFIAFILSVTNSMELGPYRRAANWAATVRNSQNFWSLSWARSIQTISYRAISPRSILILTTHLCFGLSSDLFLSDCPINKLYVFLLAPIRATCPAHYAPRLYSSNYAWGRVQITKFLIMHFSPSSYDFIPLRPSFYFPLLMLDTEFHTHTEPQAKL